MKRNGLVLAGGIIGILRGAFGIFTGVTLFPSLGEFDAVIPGIQALILFEFALAAVILIVSIWAIVKANDPTSGSAIRGWGIAIALAGVVDLIWGMTLMGPQGAASGVGSLIALALIGILLAAGGNALAKNTR